MIFLNNEKKKDLSSKQGDLSIAVLGQADEVKKGNFIFFFL